MKCAMRYLSLILLASILGCGTFAAHYDGPNVVPYAGVQASGKAAYHFLTTTDTVNLRADQPRDYELMTEFDKAFSRTLLVAEFTLDLPLSFCVDTVLLPFQAYWYLNPDAERIKLKEESEKQRVSEAK